VKLYDNNLQTDLETDPSIHRQARESKITTTTSNDIYSE